MNGIEMTLSMGGNVVADDVLDGPVTGMLIERDGLVDMVEVEGTVVCCG